MKIRTFENDDFDRTLSMWNRSVLYDQMTPELFEEKLFEDPDYSPRLTSVVEHDRQIVAFVMGVIRKLDGEEIGNVKLLAVHRDFRRQRLGTRLLQGLEAEFTARKVKRIGVFDSNPNYLTPGVDPRCTATAIFFERNGFERLGETANMEVDLSNQTFETFNVEEKLYTQGIEIRRAIMGDRDQIFALLKKHWPAWIPEIEKTLLNYPISLHIACDRDKVVAFSAYDGNNRGTGWFGPMGTDPAVRGSGLGAILLRRCLADIKKQGRRFAIIPWVGPYGFYSHHVGARISRIFWRYQKRL